MVLMAHYGINHVQRRIGLMLAEDEHIYFVRPTATMEASFIICRMDFAEHTTAVSVRTQSLAIEILLSIKSTLYARPTATMEALQFPCSNQFCAHKSSPAKIQENH